MATSIRAAVCAVFAMFALIIGVSARLGAAPQQPASVLPVSLDRIREGLEKTAAQPSRLNIPLERPVATFKTSVEQRVFVLSLEDWIHKEFSLTALQRQSAEWGSKCCGLNLNPLLKSVGRALERRKVRKIREQIARELAQLEAAKKK